ncbi:hypothetical protein AAG570_003440 [Ranatra chinensis]|uniref:Sodium/nucleoside cotransporter n=1 Tax=Ranatra chinensis TaxID=642074 RepID=A0ABD0Y4X2_9HEMI
MILVFFGLFQINWPTVLSGFALQLAIALLTVRWDFGRSVVECFANKVEHFLEFAYAGAAFAYGDLLVDKLKVFAFQSLSVLFFLSMVVQIMFYYGWIQAACFKVGSIIQAMLGTTICESVNAACIPFLGMSEAPLLYKPYITYLTPSELHAIMSGGFASCAGSLFAAYTALGVNPTNLITAASMAGPGSLYLSKLFYPENKKTKTSSDNIVLIKSFDDSVMSAACKGASSAVEMIQGIVANVIACVAFVAFLNGIVGWFGQLAGVQGLSFEYILGEVFIPLAWIMGVTPSQCEEIGRLIGLKTAVNEFVAYEELGKLKKAGRLTQRSEAIATFALCGFANPGSLSLMIATLGTLSPSQRSTVIDLSVRAFVCGSCTSFMAASLIGELSFQNPSLIYR